MNFQHDKAKQPVNGFKHHTKVVYIKQKTIGSEKLVKVGLLCNDCKRIQVDGYEMAPT